MSSDVRWAAGVIIDSFIDPFLSSKERWINTVVDRYALLPGYKEGIRYLNRMYNADLIDKDFPLYKSEDTMNNLIKSGVVGSFGGNWDQPFRENVSLMADLQKNIPDALYVPIDSFPSADGLTHKRGTGATSGLVFFIPSSSKDPKAALRYANWLARSENYYFLQFGPEGIIHEIVNGVPKMKNVGGRWILNSAANIDYTFSINGYVMETPELTARVLANSYPWPPEYITEAYMISSNNAIPEPVVPATLYASGPLTQTLTDKAAVFYIESIVAKPDDFDKVWSNGINDWLFSGAQSIIDERRAKYFVP
jgi:putative aldouronate transport system substrate-binding protein